ncbi:4'-phosphopantetheinyl transferase family protein [Portibacter marinus]|uniref:4'-phosphopantetheinyl transferase family protein n=1 Tax=Portibacter marinus TaxID=2898660 RepID=UPI001F35D7EF|nr:4'-phosphopantetheinyl transferase superfamily protein [Portibacter marinus]
MITSEKVHIWQFLVTDETPIERLKGFLNQKEKIDSEKFVLKKDRDLSIASKYMLKKLLSNYLNQSLSSVKLYRDHNNKPYLKDTDLKFNLSHSNSAILVAITLQNSIGVDIEDSSKIIDVFSIVNRYFSSFEIESLKNTDPDLQVKAFYNLWTRKEAFIKALGGGLSIPLVSFGMESAEKNYPHFIHLDWNGENQNDWTIYSYKPFPKYQASCVVKNQKATFEIFDFKVS